MPITLTARQLAAVVHRRDIRRFDGSAILRDGWQRPPLELHLRRGAAPVLADGNHRVAWLAANGGGDVEIPVKLVIR